MIGALGTIVGALAATPIHYRFGEKGLLIMAACAAVVAVVALWAARPAASADVMLPLRVIDLGRKDYAATLELQRRLCARARRRRIMASTTCSCWWSTNR